jgi:15-cis-phytoene synthase
VTDPDLVGDATETIRAGSKSFAAAARLFGPHMRESAVLLYAWCRHCDDVVDGQVLGHEAGGTSPSSPERALDGLERLTRAALAGEGVTEPAFAGLREVVSRHAIPDRYPLQHLDGFRMDVAGRRYETLADTLDYAYHVAGVVGVMMAYVMGVRDPAVLDRASDLGIGFQLTNIARDIVEDAAIGRVYLPGEWLREAGIPADAVGDPSHRLALAGVAARLLDAAEPYYDSAAIGVRALPFRAAWAIATARGVYRQIGVEVRRRGSKAWDERVSTSRAQKIRHVGAGLAAAVTTRAGLDGASTRRRDLYERPA